MVTLFLIVGEIVHCIQRGLLTAVCRVEPTTEGLEPYHDILHLPVDASFCN